MDLDEYSSFEPAYDHIGFMEIFCSLLDDSISASPGIVDNMWYTIDNNKV